MVHSEILLLEFGILAKSLIVLNLQKILVIENPKSLAVHYKKTLRNLKRRMVLVNLNMVAWKRLLKLNLLINLRSSISLIVGVNHVVA